MRTPLITVIVPVYKAEAYLHRCLDSVLAQSYEDWMCILVDDGSPDASGQICDDYAVRDSRFKVLHKSNGGASSARNLGMQHATGDFICFIDSDDYVSESYISDLYEDLIVGGEEKDIVIHGMMRYCQDKVIDRGMHVDGLFHLKSDASAFFNQINIERYGGPVCKLFRKSIIDNNKLRFDTGIKLAEDLDFLLRYLPYCNSIKVSSKNNYYYMENATSATTRLYSFEQELYGLNALAASWSSLCDAYSVGRLTDLRGASVAYYVYRCVFSIYHQGGCFQQRMNCYCQINEESIQLFRRYRKEDTPFMRLITFLVGRKFFGGADMLLRWRIGN